MINNKFDFFQEYYEAHVYEEGQLPAYEERHEAIHMQEGETVDVVLAMPFLDVNPLVSDL